MIFAFLPRPSETSLYCEKMTETIKSTGPVKPRAIWRALTPSDLEQLIHVANELHPDLPERDEVFLERIKLFPSGCLALVESGTDKLCGYLISHPIRQRQPPSLNSLLGEIAPGADQYYIHDLAILPEFRRSGLAQECIERVFGIAKRFSTTCLVSVYGTSSFWARFGFIPVTMDEDLKQKLLDYGEGAVYLEGKNEGH